MTDELDDKTKLSLYRLVINRYKNMVNEKESRSISEIRQLVSPYNPFIEKFRDTLISDIVPYVYQNHFFMAATKAISYVREIKTCQFAFNFWMSFEEMTSLRVGTAMDKAIFLAALLRAYGSENAKVIVSKKGKIYVRFAYEEKNYLVPAESGSLLSGDDTTLPFGDDPILYSFNDLVYENYEDL
ncbi:hypothetical protein HY988_07060 [Candidatus Micrarchaeota archaeon]|nr:hypothetical protein [Candidatus Micrarchaeota archaeon]